MAAATVQAAKRGHRWERRAVAGSAVHTAAPRGRWKATVHPDRDPPTFTGHAAEADHLDGFKHKKKRRSTPMRGADLQSLEIACDQQAAASH